MTRRGFLSALSAGVSMLWLPWRSTKARVPQIGDPYPDQDVIAAESAKSAKMRELAIRDIRWNPLTQTIQVTYSAAPGELDWTDKIAFATTTASVSYTV